MFGKNKIFKIIEKSTLEELEKYIEAHPEALELQFSKKHDLATPLLYAVSLGKADKMQALIDAGANIDAVNAHGWKALHLAAAKNDDSKCLTVMLQAGADINALTTGTKRTALSIAASRGYGPSVMTLINNEADLNTQDRDGWTALHYATYADRELYVEQLLKAGIDPTITAHDGRTANQFHTTDAIKDLIKAAIVKKNAPPAGVFVKEGDYLVSITEVAPACDINETVLYNFDTKTVSYRDNNEKGETLRLSFESAISKTQLKSAADFLKQHDGDVRGFKLAPIQ